MSIKVILRCMLDLLCGLVALLGALLVGWNSIEVYYLVTDRIRPDFEQPPLFIVVLLLIVGLIFLFGGWGLHKRLRKDSPV